MPYLKDEDVEYFFDNIYQEYAENNIMKKSQSQKNSFVKTGVNQTNYNSSQVAPKAKGNPFIRKQSLRERWATTIESQEKLQRQIIETQLQRKNLVFDGGRTP